MTEYPVDVYARAWTGLMVSHPVYGGGVIVRVVRSGSDILVPVRFHSGYRKTFTAEQVLPELKSLWGRMSRRLDPLDRISDNALQSRVAEAQDRHDRRCQVATDDLEERLSIAAGIPIIATMPKAGSAAAWTW